MHKFSIAFKALANEKRLQVFEYIRKSSPGCVDSGSCTCVTEVAKALSLPVSSVSEYIKELVSAGLVSVAKEGNKVFCKANTGLMLELANYFQGGNKMDDIKKTVRKRYGEVASRGTSCCGDSGCCSKSTSDADLGLGCGNPVELAELRNGQTVLDVGSGSGNDCFKAAEIVGDKGRVIGVDMTPEMVERARMIASREGYGNVEFRLGDIESLPVESTSVDVVISNCVINLVPDKEAVFKEIFRVLRPGGTALISDIVLTGELPPELKEDIDAYAACVSGAVKRDEYLELFKKAGFENIDVRAESGIAVSKMFPTYKGPAKVSSISIYACKPEK